MMSLHFDWSQAEGNSDLHLGGVGSTRYLRASSEFPFPFSTVQSRNASPLQSYCLCDFDTRFRRSASLFHVEASIL